MKAGPTKLRDLDARLVPRMAAGLRSAIDSSQARSRALRDRAQHGTSSVLSGGGALRRLDDRYASHGPLKLLRDVPQLGVLLVAAVFLAGTGAALALSGPEQVRERERAEREAALPMTLGPAVGDDIDAHFEAARERAVDLSRRSPGDRHLALVSLNEGLTPDQVGELLLESGLDVRRAYLRAPVAGNPEEIVFQTPGDVVAGLRQLFSTIAARKAQEQQELIGTAETIESGTPEEQEFRELYLADARLAGLEAAAYRSGCACVFALVVDAETRELAELPALPVVRGVEIAPAGAEINSLDIRPLRPEVQGVVPPEPTPESDGS